MKYIGAVPHSNVAYIDRLIEKNEVVLKNEGNVILSERLVLQDADVWRKTLDETSTPFNNMI